jgi:hypothetical protein
MGFTTFQWPNRSVIAFSGISDHQRQPKGANDVSRQRAFASAVHKNLLRSHQVTQHGEGGHGEAQVELLLARARQEQHDFAQNYQKGSEYDLRRKASFAKDNEGLQRRQQHAEKKRQKDDNGQTNHGPLAPGGCSSNVIMLSLHRFGISFWQCAEGLIF